MHNVWWFSMILKFCPTKKYYLPLLSHKKGGLDLWAHLAWIVGQFGTGQFGTGQFGTRQFGTKIIKRTIWHQHNKSRQFVTKIREAIVSEKCCFFYLGAKLSALLSWCQIVRCQIVWCQIVRCQLSYNPTYWLVWPNVRRTISHFRMG